MLIYFLFPYKFLTWRARLRSSFKKYNFFISLYILFLSLYSRPQLLFYHNLESMMDSLTLQVLSFDLSLDCQIQKSKIPCEYCFISYSVHFLTILYTCTYTHMLTETKNTMPIALILILLKVARSFIQCFYSGFQRI